MFFVLGIVFWSQNLYPISTHRPTQGIHAGIMEKGALQVESGYQPIFIENVITPEAILQARLGVSQRAEIFLTSSGWHSLSLSAAAKANLLQKPWMRLSTAIWGYFPTSASEAGGQLWILSDYFLSAQGTLTLNLVGGRWRRGTQLFLTTFYTHALGSRWATWIEAFAYVPATPQTSLNRWGGGIGLQYLFGTQRLWAMDIAGTLSLPTQLQLLFGISGKGRLLSTSQKPAQKR